MTPLTFIVVSLGVYRLARMIAGTEYGPFHIFENLRTHLGRNASSGTSWLCTFLAELFNCPFCLGIWISLVAGLYFKTEGLEYLVTCIGLAGAQTLFQSVDDYLSGE